MKFLTTLLFALLLAARLASAQSESGAGEYVLHANAINSLELMPDVAIASGVTRSASRGLLTIAIRKMRSDGSDAAVRAAVSADALSFSGQRQILSLREVTEGDAIYYLAEARIAEGETFTFEVSARPQGDVTVLQTRFQKAFFAPLPK